ncbi:MAG: hypothetical protein JST08_03475, partial [Actinobacteria bacterium]|nr:hypothetical protein [Actinomycetota bacterium]
SLTGADIKVSTLGKVPQATSADSATNASHATNADTAGHADSATNADHANSATNADHATSADTAAQAGDASTLESTPASAFALRSNLQRIAYETHWETDGGAPRTIFAAGPLTLTAVCFSAQLGGTHTYLELRATGPAGSSVDYSLAVGGGSVKVGNTELEPGAPSRVAETIYSGDPNPTRAAVLLVYRDATRTFSIPLGVFAAGDSDACRVSGSATLAAVPRPEPAGAG